jgi:(Z)-2-((N-methylformamido)methylene)-5-hydroxybutyrolactone dehydrogenase
VASSPDTFLNLVDGRQTGAASGATLDSVDPATGTVWATIPRGGAPDVDHAVAAASQAFHGWWGLPSLQRAAYLRAVGETMARHSRELAEVESRDNGRPLAETIAGDLPACVQMFHFHAGAADKVHGDTMNVGPTSFNFTRREPIGVIGIIIPWNSPLSLVSAKAGAALAAGNTVVIKPAEQASCSVLRWSSLLEEAGLPPGVVNVVAGLGEEAGDALVRHPGVRRITFTGATGTGRIITERAAGTLSQLHLELGGKSPNIVFADADLDAAAVGTSTAAVFTGGAGQTCVAGSRILVQAPVFDEMTERITKEAAAVTLGGPLDEGTTMGPIVSAEQFERVRSYVELGRQEGKLVFGGASGAELFPKGSPYAGGYFVEPTLFVVDGNDHRICRDEIFGPVAVAMPFDTDDEAIALANDSSYGLAAGVWTSDLKRAHRMVRDLQAGSVWVNAYRRIHWALPFGGVKDSGYGRDSGIESVLENTQLKTAWIELT